MSEQMEFELASVKGCSWCGELHEGGPDACESPITSVRAARRRSYGWDLTVFLNGQLAGTLIVRDNELDWFCRQSKKVTVEP